MPPQEGMIPNRFVFVAVLDSCSSLLVLEEGVGMFMTRSFEAVVSLKSSWVLALLIMYMLEVPGA
jgi:hypothetical protein